ncbi:MAG: hypothetical protein GKS00_26805 [Alphaproteobacteria bacterium]|nr:hypothetical protein [Alphaproteobacteria bacterium]
MRKIGRGYGELFWLSTRPIFLLSDLIGVALLLVSHFATSALGGALAAVGSAFLAIGLSLPIALYYQLRENSASLKILDACSRSGIKAIYESRQEDSADLRSAIDDAVKVSADIRLLGVAFHSLFNPSAEYTSQVRGKISDPRIPMRVLLLNPDSLAAKLREEVEEGHKTIDNIRDTINNGIPATIQERLDAARLQDPMLNGRLEVALKDKTDDAVKIIAENTNFQVRIYDTDPMTFRKRPA